MNAQLGYIVPDPILGIPFNPAPVSQPLHVDMAITHVDITPSYVNITFPANMSQSYVDMTFNVDTT